jgi:hypothetical protein
MTLPGGIRLRSDVAVHRALGGVALPSCWLPIRRRTTAASSRLLIATFAQLMAVTFTCPLAARRR